MASKAKPITTKDIMTRLSLEVDRALLDALQPYAVDGKQKDLIRAALYAYLGLDFPPDLTAAGFSVSTIPATKSGTGSGAPIVQNIIDTGPIADLMREVMHQPGAPPSPFPDPPRPTRRQ